jgi:membrane fusion protein
VSGETHSLFRQEAIEFQRDQRQWGEAALPQPLSAKLLAWFNILAFTTVITFLCLAPYSRKETVVGYLSPAAGTAKVFAPRAGVISAVYVKQGQWVDQGENLLKITSEDLAASGGDVNAALLATLKGHKTELGSQIGAEETRTNSERERLNAVLHNLLSEKADLDAQAAVQSERIGLAEKLVSSASQLTSKGYMSDLEFTRRQEGVLEQKQNLSNLRRQMATLQNQITEARYSLEQLPTVMAEKVQLMRNELATTEQRTAEIEGKRAFIIRAPIAGRVAMLDANVGQAADTRRPELEILPEGSALQAELLVPTRAAGFLHAGQDVRILYDAFPYQNFGTYYGHIVQVSQTILSGADATTPVSLKEPAYKVDVELDRPDVDAGGKKIPLQAGMLLKADIILERRPLITWLINPLLEARM